MLDRKNAVCFLPSFLDACGLWRMFMPHLSMPGSSIFIFAREPDLDKIVGNDIVVVQRCFTPQQFRFLEVAAKFKMKIVYDLDDNVWDLPDYNPAKGPLTQYRHGFEQCIRMVDVVSVSTPTLAKIVKQRVKNMTNMRTGKDIPIIVAENRINTAMFAPPNVPADKVVIGWAGSASHIGDLPVLQKALMQFCNVAGVEIELRGINLPSDNPIVQAKNYRFAYWTPVAEYPARMPVWGWNIALAPVTDHEFNNSKSCIKMIEAGYCGIPCLASWVKPYEDFCRHHPDLKWLLCSGASAWETKLRELVHEPAKRAYYGQLMNKVVTDHYAFNRPHEGWEQVFATAHGIANQDLTRCVINTMLDAPGPVAQLG